MNNPFIIALDFPTGEDVKAFLQSFPHESLFVKVGMELYYQEGPEIVHYLKGQGHRIFLDLKLHDIPNTVKRAMQGLARLGVDLVNVHAAGGTRMMEAALEGLEAGTTSGEHRPFCIAVTQLTSTSEQMLHRELWIDRTMEETVLHYAALAKQSGLDGVVCSAKEVPLVRKHCGEAFLTVTPGVRFADDDETCAELFCFIRRNDADLVVFFVIGRSITRAENPVAAYERLQREWKGEENE